MEKKVYRNLSLKNRLLIASILFLTAFVLLAGILSFEDKPRIFLIAIFGLAALILFIFIGSWNAGVIITDEGIATFSIFQEQRFVAWVDIDLIKCINQSGKKEIPLDKVKTLLPWKTIYILLFYNKPNQEYSPTNETNIQILYQKRIFEEIAVHLKHHFDNKT